MTTGQNKYRAVFISDLHLGSKHCQAGKLYEFLREATSDLIYLVGDVFDNFLFIEKWPPEQLQVLQLLAGRAMWRTRIIYIPGNHDHILRNFIGRYGNLTIAQHHTHVCVNKEIWMVTHGDETDLLGLNWFLRVLALFERLFPISGWELLRKFFKRMIVKHTDKYEEKILSEYTDYDGVICGHIHFPKMDKRYFNCGDWVQHCSAIVEHHHGDFELLQQIKLPVKG